MKTLVAVVVFAVCLTLSVAIDYSSSFSGVVRKMFASSTDEKYARENFRTVHIRKRAVPAFIREGREAFKLLLKSAKEVPSIDLSTKVFEKTGGYKEALKDFKAIKPKPASSARFPYNKIFYKNKIVYGKVGDRLLKFDKAASGEGGKPTIIIYRKTDGSRYSSYKIVYKDVEKDRGPR